jgi:pyruvate/2-oxoacid:ferredoxin oxidoreductase beta subunit/Pyruvate/2-oxoacid:ferredoxin oxidoreductase gamma subunit
LNGPAYKTYLNDDIGPLPYCPGCGHATLAKSLDQALVELQVDPRRTVLVTDIGCIGLTCRHFLISAFHGLHGRSITYGCGLKLARPELTVIVLKGDGACGIGGTHLLNVARRNIGIKLIVANNFNYGMTGGQHSVTTPSEGITSTTPWGNVEAPMDLCATAVAAGAPWVYRTTVFEKDLSSVIAEAIRQPGFAMIDAWELCSAYYQPRNEMKKKELYELLDRLGFKTGLQVDKPRPEYSDRYREAYRAGKSVLKARPEIVPAFDHGVDRQTGIIIAGSAGQKIKSVASLFAEGAMFSRLNATQKDDYPITVQTGHSVAEIIVSPETIEYTGIDSPDYVVLVSEDGLSRVRDRLEGLGPGSTVLADASLELPATRAKVIRLPFKETAKKAGRLSIAVVALAALLETGRLFPVEAFITAIRTFQKTEIAQINANAAASGAEIARSG